MERRLSSNVTLTNEPFHETCLYDERPVGDYVVELGDSRLGNWVTVALRNVEGLEEVLLNCEPSCAPTTNIKTAPEEDHSCFVCQKEVEEKGLMLSQNTPLYIHDECSTEAAAQLNCVWKETGSLLSAVLSSESNCFQ